MDLCIVGQLFKGQVDERPVTGGQGSQANTLWLRHRLDFSLSHAFLRQLCAWRDTVKHAQV